MDPPADGMGLQPEKLEEEKEGGPLFHCDLCDADIVYKIALSLLPGLGSACIDNTTGGLFKTPAAVAAEIRKEMVDYLVQRSENYVAESVVLEGAPDVEASIDPYDVISDFVDDFVSSKRNFFSRVSGWLLSDRREDWIDDFLQELEVNGFWVLNRRSKVAQTLLKNLDFKNVYHCNMSFKSELELEEHKSECSFRTMTCSNEGCDSSFSASQMENHDSTCPFKMLQCEQNCPEIIMRREMDRHCITTCPMKLVKCPFHSVGCQSTVPQSTIEQHRTESISDHLLFVLQVRHKEASPEDLKERVIELEKLSSPGRLESARDARSLTFAIKDLDAKLGPIKAKALVEGVEEEDKKSINETEEKTDKSPKHVHFEKPPSEKDATADSRSDSSSDHEKEVDGSSHVQDEVDPMKEENRTSPVKETHAESSSDESEVLPQSPVKNEKPIDSPPGDVSRSVTPTESPHKEENPTLPVQADNFTEKEKHAESSSDESEVATQSPPVRNEMPTESPHKEENPTSPVKGDNLTEEVSGKETHAESSSDESEVLTQSPPGDDVSSSVTTTVSPQKEELSEPINREEGEVESTPAKERDHSSSSSDEN